MWLSAFDFPILSWWKGTLCCFPIMMEAARWGWKVNNSQEKCISWILHIKDATRKVVSSPSWYVMHGFWSREEITENGRLEKHKASSDSPAVADQWNRHPCCHESGAESGQTASSVLLWFISSWVVLSLELSAWLSYFWDAPAQKTSALLSYVHTRYFLTVHLLWFTHPPSLDMDCQRCPCAPTAFLSPAACLQP